MGSKNDVIRPSLDKAVSLPSICMQSAIEGPGLEAMTIFRKPCSKLLNICFSSKRDETSPFLAFVDLSLDVTKDSWSLISCLVQSEEGTSFNL